MSTRIPFVLAKFPDDGVNTIYIERRFKDAWRKQYLRRAYLIPLLTDGSIDKEKYDILFDDVSIPDASMHRIRRRARAYVARYEQYHEILGLPSEPQRRLEPFRDGVDLVPLGSPHRADEVAAAMHAEFPWLAAANEHLMQELRRGVRRGDEGVRLAPLLLIGPPGIGKSAWARRLSFHLGVPSIEMDAAGEGAAFSVAGAQRGWGTAGPGRPIEFVGQTRVANPIIIINELEKAGRAVDMKGRNHDLGDALLSLWEQSSAVRWNCPYFRLPFDMSWISWIATGNSLEGIPEPLRDRCTVIELPALTSRQLLDFARREGTRRNLAPEMIDVTVDALERSAASGGEMSLRLVGRLLDRADDLMSDPWLH